MPDPELFQAENNPTMKAIQQHLDSWTKFHQLIFKKIYLELFFDSSIIDIYNFFDFTPSSFYFDFPSHFLLSFIYHSFPELLLPES